MKITVEFKSPASDSDEEFELAIKTVLNMFNLGSCEIISIIPSGEITFDLIEEKVLDHMKLTKEQLHKKSRKGEIVTARRLCYYLSRENNLGSFSEIGFRFGKKDHATSYASWVKCTNFLESDAEFKKLHKIFIESFLKN